MKMDIDGVENSLSRSIYFEEEKVLFPELAEIEACQL